MLFLLIQWTACINNNNDTKTTKTFTVSNFSNLSLETIGEVIFEQSNDAYVKAEGSADLIKRLNVSSENNTLYIKMDDAKSFSLNMHNKLSIRIGAPTLESVNYTGTGSFKINKKLIGKQLDIKNDGAGEIKIENCNVAVFNLTSNGVGSVEVSGTTDQAYLELSGVGEIDCTDLKAINAKVSNQGVGSVSVYAKKNLETTLSGTGSIDYYGNPSDVKSNTTGVGQVTNKGQ
jgi:hypothetical protein